MKEIVINIIAKTGAGKTTVARMISDLLSDAGFTCSLNDIDYLPSEKITDERINNVAHNTSVIVNVVQAAR
jgi:uridine kinase